MCAASRAVRALLSSCLVTCAAHAQAPAISPGSAPPTATAGAALPAPPSPPDATPSAIPFTPAPVPAFTAAPPAATPPPVYVAPAYVAPVAGGYVAPVMPGGPVTAPVQPAADAAPRRDARYTDANVDHVVWMPTAETHPKGTWYFSSYELVMLQAGVALSDDTQLTLTFIPVFTKELSLPLDVSLKGVFVRSRRVRVAAIGSASGVAQVDDQPGLLGRVGAVTQLCFDDACRSSLNLGANLLMLGNQLLVADAVGGIFRVSNLTAILAEVQSLVPFGKDVGKYNGVGGALGVRLSGARWGVDLSVQAVTNDDVPQLIPVVVGTYRTAP